jgi:hypothetical protein
MAGVIFKRVTKRLGIRIKYRKFRDPDKAMQALDDLLEKGIPVGMLVGVFHLLTSPGNTGSISMRIYHGFWQRGR